MTGIEQMLERVVNESSVAALVCLIGWFLERQNSSRLTGIIDKSNERLGQMSEVLTIIKERMK